MEKYQKRVVTQTIKWDTLSKIHLETARGLAAENMNLRLQTPEIQKTEDTLNTIWQACLKGEKALDAFKDINLQWAGAIRRVNKDINNLIGGVRK